MARVHVKHKQGRTFRLQCRIKKHRDYRDLTNDTLRFMIYDPDTYAAISGTDVETGAGIVQSALGVAEITLGAGTMAFTPGTYGFELVIVEADSGYTFTLADGDFTLIRTAIT